jgi:hypothetical protein
MGSPVLSAYSEACWLKQRPYFARVIHTYSLFLKRDSRLKLLSVHTCAVHSNPPANPPTAAAKHAITQEKVTKYSRKITEIRNPQTYIQYPHVPITKPLFHPIASTSGLATKKAVRAKHTYNIPPQILLRSFPNSALA